MSRITFGARKEKRESVFAFERSCVKKHWDDA